MEEKELVEDYLQKRLDTQLNNARLTFSSCTMSTVRWLQRYSHCYSFACSFFCLPLWLLILPIAFVLDIFIYAITAVVFLIAFVVYLLLAPCLLEYQFISCSAACDPRNIYRLGLTKALAWSEVTLIMCSFSWMTYCGTGDLEGGAPLCCIYCCCTPCRHSCYQATHVQVNDQVCAIL